MERESRGVNNSHHSPKRTQDSTRQPRSSTGVSGSKHDRAQVASGPVRDRIDSNWAPGMPDDPGLLPTTMYQALAGRVYTLVTWPDESTARGEVPIEQLEDMVGRGNVREGWYSISGDYLGDHPPASID